MATSACFFLQDVYEGWFTSVHFSMKSLTWAVVMCYCKDLLLVNICQVHMSCVDWYVPKKSGKECQICHWKTWAWSKSFALCCERVKILTEKLVWALILLYAFIPEGNRLLLSFLHFPDALIVERPFCPWHRLIQKLNQFLTNFCYTPAYTWHATMLASSIC